MSRAYYNEHDPYAVQWLRNLISAGEIAPGDVDERSIEDVVPSEVAGYTQRHWFAGIGGWSLALRRAGVSDDRPIDTASCPCQPFSQSGKKHGFADERHLWPSLFHILCALRPVEPGTFPLAPGLPRHMGSVQPWLRGLVDLGAARRNRIGRLKGYGNAINIDTAVAWIKCL